MLSKSEQALVAHEFPEHLARMRGCLQQAGRHASDSDIALAWARYPDSLYASWLSPPSNDAILAQILLSQLPPTSATEDGLPRLTLKEANEENGGAILALPHSHGWTDWAG